MKENREVDVIQQPGGCISPPSIVVTIPDNEFEREVLERMGRMETKIDMLVGNGQPGRMRCAEERISVLEKNDIRRSVYDRLVNGFIAVVVSAAIALHDHFGVR